MEIFILKMKIQNKIKREKITTFADLKVLQDIKKKMELEEMIKNWEHKQEKTLINQRYIKSLIKDIRYVKSF